MISQAKKSDRMKIGIFDSGFGGLSVLHEAYHRLGATEYLFYADLDHVPYGLKTSDQIKDYTRHITRFLIDKGADAIVIACNTATAVAVEDLRREFSLPILGMEPAVKPAVEETSSKKRILVIATPVTIREKKLSHLLERVDEDHRVDLLAMPHLVTFAENEQFEGPEVDEYIHEQFASFDLSKYQALVLGCTHFNYFKPSYKKVFGDDIHLIDGNVGTIRHLADVCGLEYNAREEARVSFSDTDSMLHDIETQYFVSGNPITEKNLLNHVLRMHNRLEAVRDL